MRKKFTKMNTSGRPKKEGFYELGFILKKQNNKYIAYCRFCKKMLMNTAQKRLYGHRRVCKLPTSEPVPETIITTSNELVVCKEEAQSVQDPFENFQQPAQNLYFQQPYVEPSSHLDPQFGAHGYTSQTPVYEVSDSSEIDPIHPPALTRKGRDNPIKSKSSDNSEEIFDIKVYNSRKPEPQDDRYDIYGKYISSKLRNIPVNTQRLLAERIINDALFMAEMGQLTLSHGIRANGSQSLEPEIQNSTY